MATSTVKYRLLSLASHIEQQLRLRYLGLGLLFVWTFCTYSTPAIFPNASGTSINIDGSWIVSAVTVVVVLFSGGVLLKSSALPTDKRFILASGGALSLGTVASWGGPILGTAFTIAGGILTEIGYGLLNISWACALQHIDQDTLELAIPAAPLIGIPFAFIAPSLSGIVGLIVCAFIPVLSTAFLLLCVHDSQTCNLTPCVEKQSKKTTQRDPNGETLFLIKIAAVLVALYFAIGLNGAPQQVEATASLNSNIATMIGYGASFTLAIITVAYSKEVNFPSLFRWIIPFSIVAVALPSAGDITTTLNSLALSACDSLVMAMSFLFIADMAKRSNFSAALGAGITQGACQLGILIGNISANALYISGLNESGAQIVTVILAFAALINPVLPVISQNKNDTPELEQASYDGAIAAACKIIQQRYSLSDRETEIAIHLVKGHSRPYIRDELIISKNTVATHIKHIYAKLGIHSREKLTAIAEEEIRTAEARKQ